MSLFRLWATVIVFGKFYRWVVWQGSPEEFVLGEIVPWALLEFERNDFGCKGWSKIGIPNWAYEQVWEKTIREMLR